VSSNCWRLYGTTAQLEAGQVDARLDLHQPSQGLVGLRWNNRALDCQLLKVGVGSGATSTSAAQASTWQLIDAYIRGCDLVATYREPLGQPFNLQLYWRVLQSQAEPQLAIELIASVQTPLWEAYPWVSVTSVLPNATVTSSEDELIFTTPDGPSYIELSYPGDFVLSAAASDSRGASPRWQFGPQFMEKGVIRRLRLRGAIASLENAPLSAAQMRAAFLAAHPPLTA
jgi:hypothetical protein